MTWKETMDDHGTDLSPEALGDAIEAAEIIQDLTAETNRNMEDGETELEYAISVCESQGNRVVAETWVEANRLKIEGLEERLEAATEAYKLARQAYDVLERAYKTLRGEG